MIDVCIVTLPHKRLSVLAYNLIYQRLLLNTGANPPEHFKQPLIKWGQTLKPVSGLTTEKGKGRTNDDKS